MQPFFSLFGECTAEQAAEKLKRMRRKSIGDAKIPQRLKPVIE
jgi:hypothetical protein